MTTQDPAPKLLALFAAALSLIGAVPVHAAPILSAPVNSASAQTNGGVNMVFVDPCIAPMVSGSGAQYASCESGSASEAFNAWGIASAGNGSVHVSASGAAVSVDTTPYYTNSYASANSTDYFAIQGPANALAVLTGSFVLDGQLDVQVSGAPQANSAALAGYSFQASLSGSTGTSSSGQWVKGANGFDQQSNISGNVFPVTSSFSFGPDGWAVFAISMTASVKAEGNAKPYLACSNCALVPGAFSAAANFGNTVYWGGIDSITVGGVALTDYQYLASASGVDYRYATWAAPVPEPSAYLMLLAGLGPVGWMARRRRVA